VKKRRCNTGRKSYRKWIDQLWAKKLVHQTILDIVNHTRIRIVFCIRNIVLNEQTIIQKRSTQSSQIEWSLNQVNEVYLLDYKTGFIMLNTKAIRELPTGN
jgi:ATP-dependent exoDNAse (exonuclease V) beta subunit